MLGMDACYPTHTYTPNREPEGALSALLLPEATIQRVERRGKEHRGKDRDRETERESVSE